MRKLQQWMVEDTGVVWSEERDQTMLVVAGQSAETVVWVEEGAVEVLGTGGGAEGWVCHIHRAPCLLGLAELLHGVPEHVESARALGPVRVTRIQASTIRELLFADPELLREATTALTERLLASARVGMLPGTEAETRLAWLFTAYGHAAGRREGQTIRLPIRRTQAQLARAIGGSERSVNRVITRWKSDRLVDKVFGEHVLYRPAELARRAAGARDEDLAETQRPANDDLVDTQPPTSSEDRSFSTQRVGVAR